MASLEHIDLLLGEAIERILEASDEIKETKNLDQREHLKRTGRIIAEIWVIREEIYKINPNLRRDFLVEYEKDQKRFETLNEIFKRACKMEKEGNVRESKVLYNELYESSRFGYFRLLAEAGLYRISLKAI